MNPKLTRTETCKKHLETLLYKNGFQHNGLPYPNLISIRGFQHSSCVLRHKQSKIFSCKC